MRKESLKNFDFNNDYKNVEFFVLEYIRYKKYSSIKNYSHDVPFEDLPEYFSPIKGFIYNIGTGYTTIDNIEIMNNCQIMSLFYSLSETFRKISPELKSEIAGFFRLYRMSYCVTISADDRTSYDFLSF